jgi:hypothetical protein
MDFLPEAPARMQAGCYCRAIGEWNEMELILDCYLRQLSD